MIEGPRLVRGALVAAALGSLAACGGETVDGATVGVTDAVDAGGSDGADASPDAPEPDAPEPDAVDAVDAAADAGGPADVSVDVASDALLDASDAAPDVSRDASDAAPDVLQDVVDDAPGDTDVDAGPVVDPLPEPGGARERGRWVGVTGVRDYVRYSPSAPSPDAGRPLILALHGCDQTPETFLDGSRLEALAEREGAVVIAPEQPAVANPLRCWNWFVGVNQTRLLGEGAQLIALLDDVTIDDEIDADAVHLTGISAGASMAAILLACHPERFASGMLVAGVPYAAASDPGSAALVMGSGPAADPVTLGDLAWVCGGQQDVAPRVLVVHGLVDDVVDPRNGDAIIEQFARVHDHVDDGVTGAPPTLAGAPAPRGLAHAASAWRVVDEPVPRLGHVTVDGLGHAWPGGDGRYAYATAEGPSATLWAGWWFFGR